MAERNKIQNPFCVLKLITKQAKITILLLSNGYMLKKGFFLLELIISFPKIVPFPNNVGHRAGILQIFVE